MNEIHRFIKGYYSTFYSLYFYTILIYVPNDVIIQLSVKYAKVGTTSVIPKVAINFDNLNGTS